MQKIQDIIQSFNNQNKNLRMKAQKQLFSMLRDNTTQFFLKFSQIISNKDKSLNIKQAVSTIIKKMLIQKDEQGNYNWDRVDPKAKLQIKEIFLQNLTSPQTKLMKIGTKVIARIASIEIPRNQWVDLIETLAVNSSHVQYNIRRSSITTLGQICHQLKQTSLNIAPNLCKQMLNSIISTCREKGKQEFVKIGLIALKDSIPCMHQILQDQQICDRIFNEAYELTKNPEFNRQAYQVLFELAKYGYCLMINYLNKIQSLTQKNMQQKNKSSLSALELWETLGTEYLQKQEEMANRIDTIAEAVDLPNYMIKSYSTILPQLLNLILVQNKEDYQSPQSKELSESAVKVLGIFIECGNKELADMVKESISKTMVSKNPGQKQASALLFGCLCKYQDKQYICNSFTSSFEDLYKFLGDQEKIVKLNTLKGFLTLSQFYPHVFLERQQIQDIVKHLLDFGINQDETIRVLSLGILANITLIIEYYPDFLAKSPEILLKLAVQLFKLGFGKMESVQSSKQTKQKIIIIIMNLVMYCKDRIVITNLIEHLVKLYNQLTELKNNKDRQSIQQVLSILHTCVLALSKFNNIEDQVIQPLCQLIDQHIAKYGIEAEIISMIGGIYNSHKKNFLPKINFYWPYLMKSLENPHQKNVFKRALTCISDLARVHENDLAEKIKEVFNMLVNYLYHRDDIDRQLKTVILQCFGDLSLGLRKQASSFIPIIIQISNHCFQAIKEYSNSKQDRKYCEELKHALIEMYHCVIFAVNNQKNPNRQLVDHYPFLATFIVISCNASCKPTLDYIKSCLYLLYDCAMFYSIEVSARKEIDNILYSQSVMDIIKQLRNHNSKREDIKECLYYIDCKSKERLKGLK